MSISRIQIIWEQISLRKRGHKNCLGTLQNQDSFLYTIPIFSLITYLSLRVNLYWFNSFKIIYNSLHCNNNPSSQKRKLSTEKVLFLKIWEGSGQSDVWRVKNSQWENPQEFKQSWEFLFVNDWDLVVWMELSLLYNRESIILGFIQLRIGWKSDFIQHMLEISYIIMTCRWNHISRLQV